MDDTIGSVIAAELAQNADERYRAFQAKLIPNVDSETIVGVRTPRLRRLASLLARRADIDEFLETLPHRLFEENQIHAFVIAGERDYERAIKLLEAFLPFVDNWATCDQMNVRVLAQRPEETRALALRWMSSGSTYTVRFGIGVLMEHFLGDRFDPAYLQAVASLEPGDYYVDMMRAWYFAEALVSHEAETMRFLESGKLDQWTWRKSIQKAIESRRTPSETKDALRRLRNSG